jgi:N-terminal domain of anti-restriction factor ArdC
MSHAAVRARPGQDRTSLYQEITDKIIAELEAGRLPWVQPWGTSAVQAPLAMPKNAATERRYSGINVLILWGAVFQHGFPGQSWLTFRQALSLGGNVRKGERGTTVVFADRFIHGGFVALLLQSVLFGIFFVGGNWLSGKYIDYETWNAASIVCVISFVVTIGCILPQFGGKILLTRMCAWTPAFEGVVNSLPRSERVGFARKHHAEVIRNRKS